jgi:hypothetical protein
MHPYIVVRGALVSQRSKTCDIDVYMTLVVKAHVLSSNSFIRVEQMASGTSSNLLFIATELPIIVHKEFILSLLNATGSLRQACRTTIWGDVTLIFDTTLYLM